MFLFLLIVQTLVAIALISVILMQRSEGGGLTSGGSPSGLMTARGAADFLTRATTILAAIFITLSIILAALAAQAAGPRTIDANAIAPAQPTPGGQLGPAQPAPAGQPGQPAIPTLQPQPGQPAPAQGQQPAIPTLQPQPAAPAAPANQQGGVPIAQ
jgi:preprotein translocase subunit SecG